MTMITMVFWDGTTCEMVGCFQMCQGKWPLFYMASPLFDIDCIGFRYVLDEWD